MTKPIAAQGDAYQAGFAQRWGHLRHPHVRALAWLLDAPDLLDRAAPQWQGQVATLGPVGSAVAGWLAALDQQPGALEAALGQHRQTRLGKYAEQLMAFYFAAQGQLHAHGLQVRASRNDTVGEFDFLLRAGAGLHHLEFATKFYLLDASAGSDFSGLVGPNLADTLGAKMRKIFQQQLTLATHPAAQALLPAPVTSAQALVKGWLFYPPQVAPCMGGISGAHCHGYWMSRSAAQQLPGDLFVLLPRLQWLAPARLPLSGAGQSLVLSKAELLLALDDHQAQARAPVMVAHLAEQGDSLVEVRRGFVVPDAWPEQARQRRQSGALPV
ncbi:DUF1853 family protein [Duganella qianjiadongensis]|uniref:DUF1853 family protein n=1 Tax=Duganella qianjiadongensis TaxID=2692176 RepID=UPI003530B1CE